MVARKCQTARQSLVAISLACVVVRCCGPRSGFVMTRDIPRRSSRARLVSHASAGFKEAYESFATEYPVPAAKGKFLDLDTDKAAISARYDNLCELLGPQAAREVAIKYPSIFCFREEYVRTAWIDLIKPKEEDGSNLKALDVILKNPGLLTCSSYGLSEQSLADLDRSATIIDALRPLGFGQGGFVFVITLGFIVTLVTLNVVSRLLAPTLAPLTAVLPTLNPYVPFS
eukprot:TRINITY_DN15116_c0_g1_i1.p1 TRINITY_DN15116_c0_g1~~TRINITY_DN15116_c0_g1_i1.p1  ORF type:complete len:229 (+),score=27.96 TRINITY_DN15116_c0_g1_i1:53-739(+)